MQCHYFWWGLYAYNKYSWKNIFICMIFNSWTLKCSTSESRNTSPHFAAGVCVCTCMCVNSHAVLEMENRQSFMMGYMQMVWYCNFKYKQQRLLYYPLYRVWVIARPLCLKVLNQCPLETLYSSTLRLGETQSSEHKMCKGLKWNNSQSKNELKYHSLNFSQHQQLSDWETLAMCLCIVS